MSSKCHESAKKRFLITLGSTYQALQQWEEARSTREEAEALAETLDLGPNWRFRIPYLRSLAVLAAWEGHSAQAIGHLRETAQLAADLGLPGEQWQIQAALGSLYQAGGEQGQAHTAFGEAERILGGWHKASRMRRCVRASWPGRRSSR